MGNHINEHRVGGRMVVVVVVVGAGGYTKA